MLLPACCCVCRCWRHLCIPCSNVAIILALSVVIPSTTDPPRLPLTRLLPTSGPSGEPSNDDNNDDPTGEPCLPAGWVSQTSTAPWRLCHARRPYLSPSSSAGVVLLKCPSQSRRRATFKKSHHTLPLLRRHPRCRRPPLRRCCHCCPPNPPDQWTWLAMLANVSVGYTTQTTDIFVCRRHVGNVVPTRCQHSVMSASCRHRVGETYCRHTLLHARRNKYWWSSHSIQRYEKLTSSQILHPLASTYSK